MVELVEVVEVEVMEVMEVMEVEETDFPLYWPQTVVSQLPGMSRSSVPQTTQEERGGREGRERREEVGFSSLSRHLASSREASKHRAGWLAFCFDSQSCLVQDGDNYSH